MATTLDDLPEEIRADLEEARALQEAPGAVTTMRAGVLRLRALRKARRWATNGRNGHTGG